MRALDFYSGVGGWALGLRLAGIDVIGSYERWDPAIETNRINSNHDVYKCDIRSIDLNSLPTDVDIIVGSPPCTQFSLSNRGGKGDIDDGLKDLKKFFSIVTHCKPRYWVMENVPRVIATLARELKEGGKLEDYVHLSPRSIVIDCAEYGLPQKRKRCFIGNIDFDLLATYRNRLPTCTLGEVVTALSSDRVIDPLYGIEISRHGLTDHELEKPLTPEEVRINEASKVYHPIYNSMSFPDRPGRPARTVTATCTRVSRESIVIQDPATSEYRRLSVREKATLQGFPITFQFYDPYLGNKETMVGNAMPPIIAYLLASAILGTSAEHLLPLRALSDRLPKPRGLAASARASKASRIFRADRRFRFAIPSLHFKSGVRFELSNNIYAKRPRWAVDFYFGPSTGVRHLPLTNSLMADTNFMASETASKALASLVSHLETVDVGRLQDVWAHRGPGGTRPLDLLDILSETGRLLSDELAETPALANCILATVISRSSRAWGEVNLDKLHKNTSRVSAGILIGCTFNRMICPEYYFQGSDSDNWMPKLA